ncbi:MAG: response regulator [Oxalobacteraceae bacterium]|nr:MAG: response regulator [Oxalobacteraceae bacterium]
MCHVLIIEDEAMIALDLESLLWLQGATSFSFAASEDEAVAAARLRRPVVITSDVTLVQGTGPAAVATIRAEHGHIPVVYISGTAPGCGPDDQLTRAFSKPLDRHVIASAFQDMWRLSCA